MYYRPFARVIASTGRLTQSCFVIYIMAPSSGFSAELQWQHNQQNKVGEGIKWEASATLGCSTCPESERLKNGKRFKKKKRQWVSSYFKGESCTFLESEYNFPLHKSTPRGYILFDNILAQVCHRFEGSFWLEGWPGLKNLWNFLSPFFKVIWVQVYTLDFK